MSHFRVYKCCVRYAKVFVCSIKVLWVNKRLPVVIEVYINYIKLEHMRKLVVVLPL
jgi:hypothetical protein